VVAGWKEQNISSILQVKDPKAKTPQPVMLNLFQHLDPESCFTLKDQLQVLSSKLQVRELP